MSSQYVSPILTTEDFNEMSWHDCPVYAFYIDYPEISFIMDMNYIVDWIYPDSPGRPFSHHISPATLVFHSARNLSLEVNSTTEPLLIDVVSRTNPRPTPNNKYIEYEWVISGHNGGVNLRSIGFTQYLRSAPILKAMQRLDLADRNGISFSRTAYKRVE